MLRRREVGGCERQLEGKLLSPVVGDLLTNSVLEAAELQPTGPAEWQ